MSNQVFGSARMARVVAEDLLKENGYEEKTECCYSCKYYKQDTDIISYDDNYVRINHNCNHKNHMVLWRMDDRTFTNAIAVHISPSGKCNLYEK